MSPLNFSARHWLLAGGVCAVAASPAIWVAAGWGWGLQAAAGGLMAAAFGLAEAHVWWKRKSPP